MDLKYDLNAISQITNRSVLLYKESQSYHYVQPSSETAEDLNQDGNIDFICNLTSSKYDLFDSGLLIEGQFQQRLTQGTAEEQTWKAVTDNITLENNALLRIFKEMSLKSSADTEIEKVSHPGEVSNISQFTLKEYNYINSEGNLGLFIPDIGTGDHTNSSHTKRKNIMNGANFQCILPLDNVFGFFTYVRNSFSNNQITLTVIRDFQSTAKLNNLLFGNGLTAHAEFRIRLSKLRWMIPMTKLNTSGTLDYDKQLTKKIDYKFLTNKCEFKQVPVGQETNIPLGVINANVHEIFIVFKEPTKTNLINNSKYIQKYGNEKLTNISIDIGGVLYPPSGTPLNFDIDMNQQAHLYKMYLSFVKYKNQINEPMLSWDDFKNLYTIIPFDFSAQDSSFLNKQTSISINLTKTNNFIPDMYVLMKLEKSIIFDFMEDKTAVLSLK